VARLNVINIVASELIARRARERVPEPCLTMDDAEQVQAYLDAGSARGSLAPLYLFNTALATELIRPGDLVLDLACGPANQLAQLAAVNADARFVGVDLSAEMLRRAAGVAAQHQLTNVEFHRADIARLQRFADESVDVVVSTLSLHHLPDPAALASVFAEVRRILKPDGRVYISDLGCLRSERAIAEFAQQYAAQQPEVFNLDYLNSLRAAFSVADFRHAIRPLAQRVRLYSTLLVPYMLVVKSPSTAALDDLRRERIGQIEAAMPPHQRSDLRMLRFFFRMSGLSTA
jgi:ubiquinone/menaquinone biosynthesis C-methylase UbiE